MYTSWFSSVMQVINNITMLAVILTGAALIREREQGTVEHHAARTGVAKIVANGLVILIAAGLSLSLVIQWWLNRGLAEPLFWREARFTPLLSARSASCSGRKPRPWDSSDCLQFQFSSSCNSCLAARRRWRACRFGFNMSCGSSVRRHTSLLSHRPFSIAAPTSRSSGRGLSRWPRSAASILPSRCTVSAASSSVIEPNGQYRAISKTLAI
jgi:hypothetical protein